MIHDAMHILANSEVRVVMGGSCTIWILTGMDYKRTTIFSRPGQPAYDRNVKNTCTTIRNQDSISSLTTNR